MTISIIADNVVIPVKHIRFSDYASNLQLEIPKGFVPQRKVFVTLASDTPSDAALMEIMLAYDAIREAFGANSPMYKIDRGFELNLVLSYLPHGRADRVFEAGNSFPLRVFLTNVRELFDRIHLIDPHSDVVFDYLDRNTTEVRQQFDCFLETYSAHDKVTDDDVLIVPDEGAINKVKALVDRMATLYEPVTPGVVYAEKDRDKVTGRVTRTKLPDDINIEGKRCIIIDDIADGGGTFIPLAYALKLKGAASVELYVTHGIFAKGLTPFNGIIDKIYVYQLVANYVTKTDLNKYNSEVQVVN